MTVRTRGTMITVKHLVKRFAKITAVQDLSFEVARGDIVGFLGPNGAGKTTTMRMLSGFLPPTGGEVLVAGFPVTTHSIEVRRRIGYLPEHCPLYPDMRVDEYLRHRAALKGMPSHRIGSRLQEVAEQCGVTEVRRRIIGQLSKGYRQRVGLADALIHEPELLILDEPTIGLDPNQIRQVRELIRALSGRHTILISSHILPEIEMTCRRVLILNKGRLMASDSTENLKQLMVRRGRVVAQIQAPAEEAHRETLAMGVEGALVHPLESGWIELSFDDPLPDQDVRETLYRRISARGWNLRELRREDSSLEDIFVALTAAPPEGDRT